MHAIGVQVRIAILLSDRHPGQIVAHIRLEGNPVLGIDNGVEIQVEIGKRHFAGTSISREGHGTGAFAAIASVPEPSTMILLSLVGVIALGRRQRGRQPRRNSMNSWTPATRVTRPMMMAGLVGMICCLLLPATSRADVVIWSEDFEGLVLGSSVDEGNADTMDSGEVDDQGNPIIWTAGDAGGTVADNVWTDVGPTGWTVDRTNVPGYNETRFQDGVKEWIGWNFADRDWWVDTAGDQDRSLFTLASGNVMVADPDEWDDASHPGGVTDPPGTGPWYNTIATTPTIPLTGLPAEVANLSFASSWRPEYDDNYHQNVNITASYDGGAAEEVLTWSSDPSSPDYHPYATNELVSVDLHNPAGVGNVVLTFGMFDAGNDWWWAVDNLNVIAVGPPLELIVDKSTGALSLNSGILSSTLNSYNITSAEGALDPAGWNAGNYASQAGGGGLSADLDSDGDVDGNDLLLGQRQGAGASFYADFAVQFGSIGGSSPGAQWEVLNGSPTQLFEAFLAGDRTVGANSGDSIGNGYNTSNGAEDLVFTYSAFGREITGTVSYTNGSTAAGVAVPEPSSLALGLFAAVGLLAAGWRKNFQYVLGTRAMNVSMMNVRGKCQAAVISPLLGLALLVSIAQADFTLDRNYQLGDDSAEQASANAPVGASGSFDSFTPFTDLRFASGSPVYATITGRPDGGTGLGVAFDGSQSQYLRGKRLGNPGTSVDSSAMGGTLAYFDTHDRGMQFWAKPGSASGAQTLVMDTNQHGVRINDSGDFSMRYAGIDYDTNVPATTDVWYHIQVVATDPGGAKMYINGVGETAASGGYNWGDGLLTDIGDDADLVLGSNTGGDGTGFTGGTEEFYTGIIDDLTLFVMGTNENEVDDFGTFNFKTDNDYAVWYGIPANPIDINGDGRVFGDGTGPAATDDVTAFVEGWLVENRHNGILFGDLETILSGDINFNGIVDLDDWSLLNEASPALGAAVLGALAAVPEPASCLLLAIAGLLGLPGLRRTARRS